MTRKHTAILAFIWLAIWLVAGCASSSETDGDDIGDGDTGGGECTTNDDCPQTTTNWTCNVAAGICVDQGTCEDNDWCVLRYGSGYACGDDGLCLGGVNPTDGDTSDGDTIDGDVIDGDTTDGDSEGCNDFSGFYSGSFACGETETLDTYVVVDWFACTAQIFYGDSEMGGTVSGDDVTLDTGKNCTGEVAEDRTVTLSCNDGCEITLTPTTPTDDHEGRIEYRPSDLRFGAVLPGESVEKELTVTNLGTGDLTITSVFFTSETSPYFSFVNPEEWQMPKTIGSGNDAMLMVRFQPSEEIATDGLLVILSDAANQPVVRVKMSTSLKAVPRIEADPPVLNFGSAPPNNVNEKFFLVKSTGGAAANVSDIRITDSQNDAFKIAWNTPDNIESKPPFTLESSFSKPVYVTFMPIQGVHALDTVYTGQAEIVWEDKDGFESTTGIELIGKVVDLSPPCIDIRPLDGVVGFGGIWGDRPGPGINFGLTQIHTPTTRQVSISNCGDQPLTLTQMMWQNPFMDNPPFTARAFYEVPGTFGDYTLQRSETIYLDITYLPTQEGTLNSSAFLMVTNAEDYAWIPPGGAKPDRTISPWDVTIGVQGTGARRGIEVLPSKLDFGLVTIDCCSRPEELTVYNIGDMPLLVESIEIGAGSDERFELIGLPSLPTTLGGGSNPQSLSFDVKYCAESEGPAVGRIEITSNDQQGQMLVVPLEGEGTTLTHQRDEFQQNTHPLVDILWVVDCSGSMGDEQDNLAANFETFINMATTWNADLHIAITSCDLESPAHSGKFQGNPLVIKYGGPGGMSQQDAINRFKDNIRLGTNCDSSELGLEAGHMALTPPLANDINDGFIREKAKLSVIFVSDEEDQSTPDVPFFIDFYRSLKGMRNVNMLELYAICGDSPDGCSSNSGGAGPGKRYIAVADACNPHDDMHFMSICSPDFTPVYENIAENLFALINQFFLSRLADPDTIVVTIDGVVDTNWEYDEDTNSIIFPEDSPPAPGQEIVVEYDTLCLD